MNQISLPSGDQHGAPVRLDQPVDSFRCSPPELAITATDGPPVKSKKAIDSPLGENRGARKVPS